MHRQHLQEIAEIRLKEAIILFNAGCFDGAYYLAGYALECGLKACVALLMQEFVVPKKKLLQEYYNHNLRSLISTAGLDIIFQDEQRKDPKFAESWTKVKDWNSDCRYDKWDEIKSKDIIEAITDPDHGVMQWIRRNW